MWLLPKYHLFSFLSSIAAFTLVFFKEETKSKLSLSVVFPVQDAM